MDIYRFFQPHFNPRLLQTPIRQQELNDLEQAASEFKKATQRLMQRFKRNPLQQIKLRRIKKLIKLADGLELELRQLQNEHPGDSPATLKEMVLERFNCVGWLAWANHVEEHYLSTQAASVVAQDRIEGLVDNKSTKLELVHSRKING